MQTWWSLMENLGKKFMILNRIFKNVALSFILQVDFCIHCKH